MVEAGQRRRDRSNDSWERQKDMTYCDRIYTTLTGKSRPLREIVSDCVIKWYFDFVRN